MGETDISEKRDVSQKIDYYSADTSTNKAAAKENVPPVQPQAVELTPEEMEILQALAKEFQAHGINISLEDLIAWTKSPMFETSMIAAFESYLEEPPEVQFSMYRLMMCLIELGQALQQMAVAVAGNLNNITAQMNAYAKKMTQIPVVLKDDIVFVPGDEKMDSERRANANQKFANMMEALRANKGLEEDKAKKKQTLLQTMKDASTQASDFLSAFCDLIRGIGSKINQ